MDSSRRVDKVFLLHIWACVPFAPLWLFGGTADSAMLATVRAISAVCAVYLGVRTWVVFRGSEPERWSVVWPVVDVALVTAILIGIGDGEDPTAFLYLLPIAYATLRLPLGQALGVAALAVAGQFAAGASAGTWTRHIVSGHWMHIVFRHFFLLLLASVILFLSREAQRLRARLALADYRRDLSAEMHDGIQHDLALMARRLDLAEAVAETDPARAAEIAVEQRTAVRRASDELRFLVEQTRPDTGEGDFATTLARWLGLISERCGVCVAFEPAGHTPLPPAYHHAVLRIVQEAVMNAVKHADAGNIRVRMQNGPAQHKISVSDDGRGFDPGAAGGGYGLQTMRARAETLGGHCHVISREGGGTRVSVRLPLSPPDGKGWFHGSDTRAAG